MLRRLLRVTGYAAHSRYLQTLSDDPLGYVPRQSDIPSPYRYSPVHPVYVDPKRGRVIIVETHHRTYDVFAIPADMPIVNEDSATQAYIATTR